MLPLLLAACSSDVERILALDGDPVAGEAVYGTRCALCHAEDGSGASGPALLDEDDASDLVTVILEGTGIMSGLREQMDDQEVADCAAFVLALSAAAPG